MGRAGARQPHPPQERAGVLSLLQGGHRELLKLGTKVLVAPLRKLVPVSHRPDTTFQAENIQVSLFLVLSRDLHSYSRLLSTPDATRRSWVSEAPLGRCHLPDEGSGVRVRPVPEQNNSVQLLPSLWNTRGHLCLGLQIQSSC